MRQRREQRRSKSRREGGDGARAVPERRCPLAFKPRRLGLPGVLEEVVTGTAGALTLRICRDSPATVGRAAALSGRGRCVGEPHLPESPDVDALGWHTTVPSVISRPLRLDPAWDALREHSRFRRLVEDREVNDRPAHGHAVGVMF
jgi:hypothetical protein